MSNFSTEAPLNLTKEGNDSVLTRKLIASFVVLVLAVFLLGRIQAASAITNAEGSLLSADRTNESFTASQNAAGTTSSSTIVVIVVTLVILAAIWHKNLKKLFLSLFSVATILAVVGCATAQSVIGNPSRKAVTYPNQVTFIIQLNGNNKQVALNVTPQSTVQAPPVESTAEPQAEATQDVSLDKKSELPSSPDYWKSKFVVNTEEILITTYCFQSTNVSGCENRDAVRVVTVTTTPVKVRWLANAITPGQTVIDEKDAFSMQSLEPNGGSTGVYTGAELIAHVAPEDAALYLANYGYSATIDSATNTWPARDLTTILKGDNAEVQSFLQTELGREYGSRSAVQQNNDYTKIQDIVSARLITHFKAKGITIDSFGLRDGNVYENSAIQANFDSAFDRQKRQEDAEADAKRQAVVNQQQIDQANAQATIVVVQAEADSKAKQLQADVVNNNPSALQQQWIQKWNGQLPQVTGGDSTSYIPVQLTPVQAPPTQTPGQ